MYTINNVLITIDFTAMDSSLVNYVFEFSKIVHFKKAVLTNVVGTTNLDEEVPNPQGEGTITKREEIIYKLESLAAKHKPEDLDIEIIYRVKNGDPLTEILEVAKNQDIDMIVVGRKTIAEGSGLLSRKLARKALCSVLTLTHNALPHFEKVLIPIDFSEFSYTALEKAVKLARQTPLEIVCLNIYNLPNGYLASGKSPEEFSKIVKKNNEKRFKHFIKDLDISGLNLKMKYQLDTRNARAKIIFNIALVEHVDMIMMGSKGKSKLAQAFLGSTTEKILLHNISIPTLVLKQKEVNVGLINSLLNM
ncbi:universal stress protein [Chondrinema litorale]|uniref:universal stress protein n=1 Tax=Chondrinema litorale TaxID=2994555 RepID=UPI0025430D98|nr:universal stress protein [Chondrinema litorale]UZR95714.1 universal stress protein [Chondrinema litorale]